MPFIKISGLRPTSKEDAAIRRDIPIAVANIEELRLKPCNVDIVYSAGGPLAGNPFINEFVLTEIILWEKPERSKVVLNALCHDVREILMETYSLVTKVRFQVLAVPLNECTLGESYVMWGD